MRIFYHRTTKENAALIVRDGFRLDTRFLCRQPDGTMALGKVYGVWLSDRPLYWRGRDDSALLEVTIYASDGFMDQYEWKGEPDYREFCVPPADLKARIISIHLMWLEEQHEAGRRMQHEVVPLVLTPSSDLDPATDARLSEMERVIDELERVIDLEAIFSNSKELGRLGCAGQELSRSGHDARRQSFRSSVC
jgi:hypothetical protein